MLTLHTQHSISKLGQIMLEGALEVIGQDDVNAVVAGFERIAPLNNDSNGDAVNASAIQDMLNLHFGKNGGDGIGLRAGRSAFYILNHKYQSLFLRQDAQHRFLPMQARLRTGLESLANAVALLGDMPVMVEVNTHAWIWRSESCQICQGRSSVGPCCHFTVGLLQACLDWTSGGRVFDVVETSCLAAGGTACEFSIARQSLS